MLDPAQSPCYMQMMINVVRNSNRKHTTRCSRAVGGVVR